MKNLKPITIAFIAFLVWLIIVQGGGVLAFRNQEVGLQTLVTTNLLYPVFAGAAFLLILVAYSNWWREVGFRAPDKWRNLLLVWLPVVYLLYMALNSSTSMLPPEGSIALLVINTIVVGINEELMFRGVLYHGSKSSYGPYHMVWITALLFGSIHILNGFITGDLASAWVQALGAAMAGVWYAALRLRIGSLYPAIIIHWLWDLFTFLGGFTAFMLLVGPYLGTFAVISIQAPLTLYGLWLLRGYSKQIKEGRG